MWIFEDRDVQEGIPMLCALGNRDWNYSAYIVKVYISCRKHKYCWNSHARVLFLFWLEDVNVNSKITQHAQKQPQ